MMSFIILINILSYHYILILYTLSKKKTLFVDNTVPDIREIREFFHLH